MDNASGAYLTDIDGNRYVDCFLALGPMFFGNSPRPVIDAVTDSINTALQFSGQNLNEARLAERVLALQPWADKLTFANTGSEAVQSALRIARGTTGRNVIVKFEGHYHGWIDPVFVNTPGTPLTAHHGGKVEIAHTNHGLAVPGNIVVANWGDLDSFTQLMAEIGDQVAAVIIEASVSGAGNYLPPPGLMEGIKSVTHKHGGLVILDEVITGFRFAPGGIASILDFQPDLATYAKAIGSGFPIALVAGTDAAMESVLDGRVTIGGTYNATPSSVAAALAVLDMIEDGGNAMYARVNGLAKRLATGFEQAAADMSVPIKVNHLASLVKVFFGRTDFKNSYSDLITSDSAAMADVSERMLAHGTYVAPKGMFFLSTEHTERDIDTIIRGFHSALEERGGAGSHGLRTR
ncbi:glutamate-1-semialdehyde 2,1-aminomutase [Antricoccus suffuscus]|uniref:Glutamate-1-semialdehyde 2,1-aminomutase n=2 Tax=Antricoccus suffuscus TaxID=1629062 RepID=A0A2T1A3C0_9ACTN|nr:glutamate-1-semialdehyde 2,1-aminomutase [Antricoccus suffuscus]